MSGRAPGPAGGGAGQRWLLWAPLWMALGIALWLQWPGEPGPGARIAAAILLLLPWLFHARAWRAWLVSLALAPGAAGFLAVDLRAALVAAPVLQARYYGPVEGRILRIDRGAGERMRLTLDRIALDAPGPWPAQVRLTLHGSAPADLVPGDRVMMTGHLAPPEAAAEPGGFDFARHAWFRSLGAVGYVRSPVLRAAPPQTPFAVAVARLRMRLSAAIQARIPGEPGAFAAAMLTGDRSAMGAAAVAALRDSNLYHLVSISGVHMSLLAGFVYQALRFLLALVPPLALRVPGHKIAALGTVPVVTFYLVLAGGDVATQRAWGMVMVMLGAILADRRALSLRSVALAALVILALQPEALVEPGFQMSFAATAALIAGMEALRPRPMPRWLRPLVLAVAVSACAGFASAPYAAAHFNRISTFGLLPNLLVTPLIGLLVMPGGVLLALLAPFGLDLPARWMVQAGTAATLAVAERAAAIEGMVRPLARPQPWGLAVLSVGGMVFLLARRPWAWLGLAMIALAPGAWIWPDRPALLISGDGRLLGLSGPEGRALSHRRGAGFAARAWAEADGELPDQERAAQRAGFSGPEGDRRFHLGPLRGRHLRALPEGALCAGADLVVLAVRAPPGPHPCEVIDADVLARRGALAVTPAPEGVLHLRASLSTPPRRWTRQPAAAGRATSGQ